MPRSRDAAPVPAPAVAPASNPATELFDFADVLALFSGAVLDFRLKNKAQLSQDQRIALEDAEIEIDKTTAQVRADGIAALGMLTEDARAEVRAATADAQAFLKRIKKAEKALGIAAAVLGLGLSVIAGKPKGVVDAVKKIATLTG